MKPRVPAQKYKQFIEFVNFLRENNAMSYFDNCQAVIFKNRKAIHWIEAAFGWATSPEGYNFWSEINHQWCGKLKR